MSVAAQDSAGDLSPQWFGQMRSLGHGPIVSLWTHERCLVLPSAEPASDVPWAATYTKPVNPARETAARVRGCMVGAASGLTAIVAHQQGHGGLPHGGAVVLMLAVCAGIGWLISARSAAFTSCLHLIGVLTAAQIACHLVLAASAGHGATLGVPMIVMHGLAILATAVLCRSLERAVLVTLTAFIRVVRMLLSTPAHPGRAWSIRTADVAHHRSPVATRAFLGTRGPPVSPFDLTVIA